MKLLDRIQNFDNHCLFCNDLLDQSKCCLSCRTCYVVDFYNKKLRFFWFVKETQQHLYSIEFSVVKNSTFIHFTEDCELKFNSILDLTPNNFFDKLSTILTFQ